jgi:cell division protein FtsI (penicillin-binding protein 3)
VGGEGVRVVSPEAARLVLDTLATVVMDKDGTGGKARPTGYTAGGKTGTARANIAHQGYTTDRYLTSFVGFAPVDDPRIVVAVTVIDPKVNRYGGTVAGPVFRNVVERVLPLLGVMPDVEPPPVNSKAAALGPR